MVIEIRAIHRESRKAYGSPRVYQELRARGRLVGRHRVARLMRSHGITVRRKRRFRRTTDSKHAFPVAANILDRNFVCEAPNRVWMTDITWVWTREGWLYLSVVLDLYSRRIIGWAIENRIDRQLTLRALTMALEARRPQPDLLHHSDRGSQYACGDYQALLNKRGIVGSMSRKGNCWDNAVVESFFGTLKSEFLHHVEFGTRAEARSSIFEFIEVFYNGYRRHSSLGYLSPADYERTALKKAVAA
jgi:transposase InsO family protein